MNLKAGFQTPQNLKNLKKGIYLNVFFAAVKKLKNQ